MILCIRGSQKEERTGRINDRTVAYTDQILHEIFEYARQNMNLQVMVYAPDHGEDMHYGHGTPAGSSLIWCVFLCGFICLPHTELLILKTRIC